MSVFTRITFHIHDISKIAAAVLHMDYDDGFVAYLNGTEIARENISNTNWNSTADFSREALMFQGKKPESFDLHVNKLKSILHNGENLLAIEGHNFTEGLIDMSLRAFLSFGLTDSESQFGPLPDWLQTTAESGLHANFKLSNSGETVYLTDNRGIMTDQLVLPPRLPVNSSVGSVTDGSPVRAVFLTGTPKASNDSQVGYTGGSEPEPDISHTGGFYADEISVTLSSSSSSSQIRFTSNGQVPDLTSELFTGKPIQVRSNKVIKARCFSTGNKLPGPVVTSSYFIGQNPTPAGILSITMETGDLYGETGIYDNWWTDWKKQAISNSLSLIRIILFLSNMPE